MDSKYTEIIDGQAGFFKYYLQECLSEEMRSLLSAISIQTNVYVFSGVIRNFFLGESCFRDLDIVVGNVDCVIDAINVINAMDGYVEFSINSFGGLKVKIQNLTIDIWAIDKTWGIKNERMELSPYSLLRTAFFNFSAIVFDYNRTHFYYEDDFIYFLKTRMMQVVYEKNPNIPLCIVNSYYYREKYGFGISLELCRWIFLNYCTLLRNEKNENAFDSVQIRHFQKIIIPYDKLKEFVLMCYRHLLIVEPIVPKFQ